MLKKIGNTVLASVLAAGFIPAVHAETLNEIYRQALENDHQFRAAYANYQAGLQSKNSGRAGLLPQINGDYDWSDGESDREGTEAGGPVNSTTESNSSGYTIRLSQPLFDLGAWHNYKKGKIDSKAAEAQFKADKQALIIRTAQSYFDALQAVDNFETAKAEENALSHSLEQTRKRFEVGLTAITDVHEAQAAFDSALARRLLEEGNVGIAFEGLEVITGNAYNFLSPLKKDFPIVPPTPANREDWVKFARENNFGLASASLNAESARQQAKISKSSHYPKITGSASLSDNNDESTSRSNFSGATAPTTDIDTSGHSFAIKLSVPIFSGGQVSSARKVAAQNFIAAQENFYQTRRDTVQSARSLHLRVLTDVATVKARKQAITSSRSALEATQAGYDVGTRDLVDVLNAQRSLYAAQRDYSNALYTYILNTLRLKEVAGILVEQDVIDVDVWLDTSRQVRRATL